MCLQGFWRFKCGHLKVYEEECDYAKELDANFWIKAACPDYNIHEVVMNHFCSEHKYFCAKTADGAFLTSIHQQRDKAEQDYKQADEHYTTRLYPTFSKSAKAWAANGGSEKSFYAHPKISQLHQVMQMAKSQRAVQLQRIAQLDHTINQAKNFFADRSSDGNAPTDGTNLKQLQLTSNMLDSLHGLLALRHGASGGVQLNSRPMTMPQHPPPAHEAPRFSTRSTKSAHFDMADVDNRQRLSNLQKTIAQKPPTGRSKAKKSRDFDSSPEKSSSVVRRSARVRDKKVNYAVDDDDSNRGMDSMSPSPQKSDVSAFSPEKSDASDTPAKSRNMRREPSSLHDTLLGNSILASTLEARKRRESSEMNLEAGSPSKKRRVEASPHYQRHPGTDNQNPNDPLADRFNPPPWAVRDAADYLVDQPHGRDTRAGGMAQAPNGDTAEAGLLDDYHGHPVQDLKSWDAFFGTPSLVPYETPNMEDPVKQSINPGLPGHLQYDQQPFFGL